MPVRASLLTAEISEITLLRVHLAIKGHKCTTCGKCFAIKDSLTMHVKATWSDSTFHNTKYTAEVIQEL